MNTLEFELESYPENKPNHEDECIILYENGSKKVAYYYDDWALNDGVDNSGFYPYDVINELTDAEPIAPISKEEDPIAFAVI